MDDLARIRFVTANYSTLQGLRSLPIGVGLAAASYWSSLQQGPSRDLTYPILFAGVCSLAYWMIDRYYARVFGRVKLPRRWWPGSLVRLLFAPLALAAFVFDTTPQVQGRIFGNELPVSVFALLTAAGILFDGCLSIWPFRRYRKTVASYLAIVGAGSLLLIAASFHQALFAGWAAAAGLRSSVDASYILVGVVLVLLGLVTHIYLTDKMGAPVGDAV